MLTGSLPNRCFVLSILADATSFSGTSSQERSLHHIARLGRTLLAFQRILLLGLIGHPLVEVGLVVAVFV